MNSSVTLDFVRPVPIEKWLEFCSSNGLVHAPAVGDSGNIFVGYSIEIALGSRGVRALGIMTLPEVFESMTISFSESDERAYALVNKICDKFETVNKDSVFEERNEKITARVLESINNVLRDFVFETPSELDSANKEGIRACLDNIQGVKESRLNNLETKLVSWKELYPSFWKRQRAKFAFKVLKMQTEQDGSPTWFMKFMGFEQIKTTEVVDQQIRDMLVARFHTDERLEEESLQAGATTIRYHSKLKVPYSVLLADVSIVPFAPVEHININIKLADAET